MNDYYWFAVRESWTEKQRLLKVLSRRMSTEQEAFSWAEFEKDQASTLNKNHRYTAIYMKE